MRWIHSGISGISDWLGINDSPVSSEAKGRFEKVREAMVASLGEAGAARPELLENLLSTTERVVQTVDSVEYGLTDINEYYANTGALARAAGDARARRAKEEGKEEGSGDAENKSFAPAVSVVEAFGDGPPRDLDAVLRLEYRSKLLNPKWAQAMAAAGSGGAFEIGQRMTAMLGWGATSGFKESWTWEQAAETYVLDEEMASTLKKNNPEAFRNVVGRMLEAAGRGIWEGADEELLVRRVFFFSGFFSFFVWEKGRKKAHTQLISLFLHLFAFQKNKQKTGKAPERVQRHRRPDRGRGLESRERERKRKTGNLEREREMETLFLTSNCVVVKMSWQVSFFCPSSLFFNSQLGSERWASFFAFTSRRPREPKSPLPWRLPPSRSRCLRLLLRRRRRRSRQSPRKSPPGQSRSKGRCRR